MLYNKGNHAKLKYVQLQPSPLQGENGGKIYSAWNPGIGHISALPLWEEVMAMPIHVAQRDLGGFQPLPQATGFSR